MAHLLPLLVPATAGGLSWWLASLTLPRTAANDNGTARATLPHPLSYSPGPC